jgi:hypothetical protein
MKMVFMKADIRVHHVSALICGFQNEEHFTCMEIAYILVFVRNGANLALFVLQRGKTG